MPHQRFHRSRTGRGDSDARGEGGICVALRAGTHVFLRGQTGVTIDGDVVGIGDAAMQAEQAMETVKALLEQAGARMEHICKVTTCITDRAHHDAVERVISRHLGPSAPARTDLIVEGLAEPWMLVAIDIDAVIA